MPGLPHHHEASSCRDKRIYQHMRCCDHCIHEKEDLVSINSEPDNRYGFTYTGARGNERAEQRQKQIERHQRRAATATAGSGAAELAALSERLKAEPALEASLSPSQLIAIALFEQARASQDWLTDHGFTDPEGDPAA